MRFPHKLTLFHTPFFLERRKNIPQWREAEASRVFHRIYEEGEDALAWSGVPQRIVEDAYARVKEDYTTLISETPEKERQRVDGMAYKERFAWFVSVYNYRLTRVDELMHAVYAHDQLKPFIPQDVPTGFVSVKDLAQAEHPLKAYHSQLALLEALLLNADAKRKLERIIHENAPNVFTQSPELLESVYTSLPGVWAGYALFALATREKERLVSPKGIQA